MPHYPRWYSRDPKVNLREVAPNLFVGAYASVPTGRWSAVVDLCGSSGAHPGWYSSTRVMLRWAFNDGDPIPEGLLDTVVPLVRARAAQGPVLIHCQAGLSRSVSVAYALLRRLWGMDHTMAMRRVQADPNFPVPQTLASARAWVHEQKTDLALTPVVGGLFRS